MFEGRWFSHPARRVGPADTALHTLIIENDWLPDPDPVQEAFDDLTRLDREIRRLEAARAEMLVDAYRLAVDDLADRFGTSKDRGGPGARSFFKQAAADLQMTEGAVAHQVDTATEAMEHLPRTWRAFAEGRAPWRAVDIAVRQDLGIPLDRLDEYDEVASHAVRTVHASRLADRLRRARERILRDTAVVRRELAEADRRVELEPYGDGQAAFVARGPAPEWVAVDHALTAAAVEARKAPDEDRSIGQLRHDLLLDILTEGLKANALPTPASHVPQRKGVAVQLILQVPVLTLLGKDDAPATIEGYGPIDVETAKRLAADAPSFVRVLTHPVTGVRLDMDRQSYRPPADLRRWLRLRDQECRDPGCRRPAHRSDIDHALEWQHDGPTSAVNLVTVCRAMHLLKSMGLWQERIGADDSVTWISPWGRTIVDPPVEPGVPAPPNLLGGGAEPIDDLDDCPF